MHLSIQINRLINTVTLYLRISAGIALYIVPLAGKAQVNISGKPGLINIPTARVLPEGTFYIGYHYNPSNNDLRYNNANLPALQLTDQVSSSVYYATLALLPRLEVNINFFNQNGYLPQSARGIGDRQFDIKYAILTEKPRRPSVAIILSAPFGYNNALITYAVAATKNIQVTKDISTEITAGIGSPYYFDRSGQQNGQFTLNDFNIFANYKLNNKNDRPNPYLSGPFGGVAVRYKKNMGAMVEWDSRHFNAGLYGTLFKHWTIQAGLIDLAQFTVGTSYSVSLLELPKRLRQKPKDATK
jgi:hypothetical protein